MHCGRETPTGRLGKDPVEEKAVRTVLREAAAARRSALAVGTNAAHHDHPHPALETIDETAGSGGGAAAATEDGGPVAGEGAAEVAPIFPPTPPSGAATREIGYSVAPPAPPPKTASPEHTEKSMTGDGDAAAEGLVTPLPTPPPPVQAPPALPPKNMLTPPPPPPPPSKPAAVAADYPATAAAAPSEFPTPSADVRVQRGITAAGAPGETGAAAATAFDFSCGAVLEGEYELEKVNSFPPYCGFYYLAVAKHCNYVDPRKTIRGQ